MFDNEEMDAGMARLEGLGSEAGWRTNQRHQEALSRIDPSDVLCNH